jgi:hypothetical protein
MADIKAIVEEITAEFTKALDLPKDQVFDRVIDAGLEVLKALEDKQQSKLLDVSISEALDKIKAVNVIDSEPMPAYQLEILKELIKKVALRKIRELEEEQLKEASDEKRRRQEKS